MQVATWWQAFSLTSDHVWSWVQYLGMGNGHVLSPDMTCYVRERPASGQVVALALLYKVPQALLRGVEKSLRCQRRHKRERSLLGVLEFAL